MACSIHGPDPGLGAAGYLRRRASVWLLPAAAVVGINLLLNLFHGHHYFVYSLHCAFSMVWIIAGVAFLPGGVRTAAIAVVALFFMVTVVNSVTLVQQLGLPAGGVALAIADGGT